MNHLFMKKIYIALVLVGSLVAHYNVQAQEPSYESQPECSSSCHHHIDVEICHDIALAKVVSDTLFTFVDTGITSFNYDTCTISTVYTQDSVDEHQLPSYQELARSHI